MDVRTGYMLAVSVILLLVSSFVVWTMIQTPAERTTERSFYELARKINQTCKGGKPTSVMVHMPQTFETGKSGGFVNGVVNIFQKTLPGNYGDPTFMIYYEHFPEDPGLGPSFTSAGWKEDLPWTRNFRNYILTAAAFELGGEFLMPAILGASPVKRAFSKIADVTGITKAGKIARGTLDEMTPDMASSNRLSRGLFNLGVAATTRNHPKLGRFLRLSAYTTHFADAVRAGLVRGARKAGRKLDDVANIYAVPRKTKKYADLNYKWFWRSSDDMDDVAFRKFMDDVDDVGSVQDLLKKELSEIGRMPDIPDGAVGSANKEIIDSISEQRIEVYEAVFNKMEKMGLANRMDEGALWKLTDTGRKVFDQIKEMAKEEGLGTFKYSDFIVKEGSDAAINNLLKKGYNLHNLVKMRVFNYFTERYATFLSQSLKDSLGRSMLELDEVQRIKLMKQLWNTNLGSKMPEDFHLRFGKSMKESLDESIDSFFTSRKFVGEMSDDIPASQVNSFDELSNIFSDKLRKSEFTDNSGFLNAKDVVGNKYHKQLPNLDLDEVDAVYKIDPDNVLEAIDDEARKEIDDLIDNGHIREATVKMSQEFTENVKFDIRYSKFMDDISQFLMKGKSFVGVPKKSTLGVLLWLDDSFKDSSLRAVPKEDFVDIVSGEDKSLIALAKEKFP
ncbi:MAG: hypothetical protein ABEK36_03075, partial [Candidatus Aenigmatarchaeota archaeon]